ncbi:beta-ketoacyl synthase N-terminal-like domain-containing protein, partial [Methylomagnum sp.]
RRLAHAPLVGAAGWRRLLNGVGFPAVTALDGPGADPLRGTPQSIILALAGGPALAAASAPVPSLVSEAAPVEPASPAAARIPAEVSLPTFLLGEISAVLAGLLDLAGRTPEPGRPFVEFGVDSLLAVEVIRALNARLGISLRKTDLFNHPTPGELAGHIAANFSAPCPAGEGLKAHRSNQNTHPRAIANTDIAVIGMAGRFPDADDLDELWRNLAAGHDAVREVPKERWDVAPLFDPNPGRPDRIYSRWGGFMRDVASFDPLFFNLTPREAETMDPQQRLFLMEAWKALENAGYSRRRLEGRRCGVFVGVTQGDYLNLLRAAGRFTDSHGSIGNSCAILPARVAYFLNLKGPCFALDTGCSSALVAVHTACQSILSGESEMALAGGVSAINTPDWHLFFCRSGMTSPTGRCHTFDDSADGFVPAEGVGVVLLKRLDRALADGDVIHGVIKAMGINQDGASNGITAPSATAQTALLREVHQRAGIAPDSLDYIETHGTGTKLGDPIELEALQDAFGGAARRGSCAIGSVKTNIGHTMATAGVAGLLKMLLALRHRAFPPSLHFETPNRHIDFDTSPFYVNTALRDWPAPADRPRRAAVSAFGFSGTNAHLVLEEAPPAPEAVHALGWPWQLVTLSALTEEALLTRCAELRRWLETAGPEAEFDAIVYTLNAGRSSLPVRLAFVVRDRAELARRLAAVPDGADPALFRSDGPVPASPDPVWAEQAAAHRRMVWADGAADEARRREALTALARLYVAGWEPDWEAFYGDFQPRRVSLPTYPFARERYWVDAPASSPSRSLGDLSRAKSKGGWGEGGSKGAAELIPATHPFLGQGGADNGGYAFRAQFRRDDVYFRDHVGGGQVLIPAAAQMEMARAAGEALLGAGKPLSLSRLTWQKPLIPGDEPLSVKLKLHGETGGRLRFELGAGEGAAWVAHSEGVVSEAPEPAAEAPLDIQTLWRTASRHYDRAEVYALFRRAGWEYGPTYQTIRRLGVGPDYCLAELARPATDAPRLPLDPFMLDGALQAVLGFQAGKLVDGGRFLPLFIGAVRIFGALPDVGHAVVTRRANGPAAGVEKFDVRLCGPEGAVVLRVEEFTLRAVPEAHPQAGDEARQRLLEALFRRVESRELGVARARELMGELLKREP